MNKDFAIKWVHTPKDCRTCAQWNKEQRICRMRQKGKPCPYEGRR